MAENRKKKRVKFFPWQKRNHGVAPIDAMDINGHIIPRHRRKLRKKIEELLFPFLFTFQSKTRSRREADMIVMQERIKKLLQLDNPRLWKKVTKCAIAYEIASILLLIPQFIAIVSTVPYLVVLATLFFNASGTVGNQV